MSEGGKNSKSGYDVEVLSGAGGGRLTSYLVCRKLVYSFDVLQLSSVISRHTRTYADDAQIILIVTILVVCKWLQKSCTYHKRDVCSFYSVLMYVFSGFKFYMNINEYE